MSASDLHYKDDAPRSLLGVSSMAARARSLPWLLAATLIAMLDALMIMALALVIGQTYYVITFADPTSIDTHLRLGAMMALMLVAVCTATGGYRISTLVHEAFRPGRLAAVFLFAILMLIALLFLEQSSDQYSRSVMTFTLAVGLPAIVVLRYVETKLLRRMARAGRLAARRLMLVGTPDRINEIARDRRLYRLGLDIVGRVEFSLSPQDARFGEALLEIAAAARRLNPDDIVLCLPWAERDTLEATVEILAELPSAIRLDRDPLLRALAGENNGPFQSPLGIEIVGRPFSRTHLVAKRAFDIAASALALLVVAPVMLVVALAIRLDSAGPIMFRQERYGYSRVPFRICKFRTMRHDCDPRFRQAARDDVRITRVGHFLRRTNLDELPQLFNVLIGDMSLVGPRPHPIELDERFSPLIEHYSRRHRVLPGITGWAQVNGLRGETETTEKMQARVVYDLYYLNNWSFGLDVRILIMTVLSAAAYRNAF